MKQSQQNPPLSLRKLAGSVCINPTNLEDMRESRDIFKMKKILKTA